MRYLALALTLSSCATIAPWRTTEQQRTSAVQVIAACPKDPSQLTKGLTVHSGSGVVVGPWTVITAAHVVPCSDGMILVSQDGVKALEARVEAIDKRYDIARLVIIKGGALQSPGRISIGRAFEGSRVCVATGIPTRDYRCGDVDSMAKSSADDLSSDMQVEPGNSGSGVYGTHGRLVGIVTRQRRSGQGMPIGSLCTSLYGKDWLVR